MALFTVLGATVLTGLAFLVGIYIPFKFSFMRNKTHRYLAFSAGFLLSVAFFKIIPKGAQINIQGLSWGLMLSYLLILLMEHFLLIHTSSRQVGVSSASMCVREGLKPDPERCELAYHHHLTSLPAFIAFCLHNVADGIGLGVGFIKGIGLGLFTFLAVLFHKLPAGMALGALFLREGREAYEALIYGTVVITFSLIGALSTFFLGAKLEPELLSVIIGFAGGSFIYLGATHMLPEAHREHDRYCFLIFLTGILSYWVIHITLS